jgi:hypothetical protein
MQMPVQYLELATTNSFHSLIIILPFHTTYAMLLNKPRNNQPTVPDLNIKLNLVYLWRLQFVLAHKIQGMHRCTPCDARPSQIHSAVSSSQNRLLSICVIMSKGVMEWEKEIGNRWGKPPLTQPQMASSTLCMGQVLQLNRQQHNARFTWRHFRD